jgi:hypothetical protein
MKKIFKPTDEFKSTIQTATIGDILYFSEGKTPHPQISGYQVVVDTIGNELIVTWGYYNKLSKLRNMQRSIRDKEYAPPLVYWASIKIDPENGSVKGHGDLQVTAIGKINSELVDMYIPKPYNFFFNFAVGTLIFFAALIALYFFVFRPATSFFFKH